MGRQSIKDRRLVTRLRGWGPGNTDASSFPPRKKNRAGYDETRIKREQTKKLRKIAELIAAAGSIGERPLRNTEARNESPFCYYFLFIFFQIFQVMNFGFVEEMGFDKDQVKTLLLTKPKLWLMGEPS